MSSRQSTREAPVGRARHSQSDAEIQFELRNEKTVQDLARMPLAFFASTAAQPSEFVQAVPTKFPAERSSTKLAIAGNRAQVLCAVMVQFMFTPCAPAFHALSIATH